MSSSSPASGSERGTRLTALTVGARGVVVGVLRDDPVRADRLEALGVTPGAQLRLLQRFPGFVFECDQTEIVVEPAVARTILVEPQRPSGDGEGTRGVADNGRRRTPNGGGQGTEG